MAADFKPELPRATALARGRGHGCGGALVQADSQIGRRRSGGSPRYSGLRSSALSSVRCALAGHAIWLISCSTARIREATEQLRDHLARVWAQLITLTTEHCESQGGHADRI